MSLTLLFDLDDTLLANDIEGFLPKYLKAFSQTVEGIIEPNKFVKALLAGTKRMLENQQADCTLQDVFEETFFPMVGISETEFRPIAEDFYQNVFPALREYTRPIPEAVNAIEEAKSRQFTVALASNPLFPQTAIRQRLTWAGFTPEKHPFSLIPSYEDFHFAKPDPAFFAELLARLDWPSDPVIMVGDDLEKDIFAAQESGIKTYWIDSNGDKALNEILEASGPLSSLYSWLDRSPKKDLQPDFTTPSAMLATLRSTPAALDSLCRKLPLSILSQRPAPGEWSLTEILCHLRDVDREVNLLRVEKIMKEDNPFLPGQDTDPWAKERRYNEENGLLALYDFFTSRSKFIEILESLRTENWERSARHAILGPTSLAELVNITTSHDRLHIQQIHQVLKSITQYSPN